MNDSKRRIEEKKVDWDADVERGPKNGWRFIWKTR